MSAETRNQCAARGKCRIPDAPGAIAAFNRKWQKDGRPVRLQPLHCRVPWRGRVRRGLLISHVGQAVGCERPADPRCRVPCLRPNNKKFLRLQLLPQSHPFPPPPPLNLIAVAIWTAIETPVGHSHSISEARASPHLSNSIPGPVHTPYF